MKPLKVALFVKATASTTRRDNRNMGWWSYAVPEFTWDHYGHDGGYADLAQFRDYDLIFHEDSGFCDYTNRGKGPPVAFLSIDSTLSEDHYVKRLAQGKQADLILVDHDELQRFKSSGRPVRRLNYCVNDKIFRPANKTREINFHCGAGASRGIPGGAERNIMRARLNEICVKAGYPFVSGGIGLDEYAVAMAQAQVVANWPRTTINRPHRVFDTLACKTALLSGRFPDVSGDDLIAGVHYRRFNGLDDLEYNLLDMLQSTALYAEAGHELVMSRHTWAIRAAEMRQMFARELGL